MLNSLCSLISHSIELGFSSDFFLEFFLYNIAIYPFQSILTSFNCVIHMKLKPSLAIVLH